MVTKDLAQLSQLHYKVDKYGKKKATKRINKKLEGTDYKLESLKRGVAVYRHKDGTSVLNSKGTDITNSKDILSDIKVEFGVSETR